MKKLANQITLISAVAMIGAQDLMAQYKLPDPGQNSVFQADSKPQAIMVWGYYVLLAIAAMAAIGCFIASGTFFARGQPTRGGGAIIGGLVCALGAWFVATAQAN